MDLDGEKSSPQPSLSLSYNLALRTGVSGAVGVAAIRPRKTATRKKATSIPAPRQKPAGPSTFIICFLSSSSLSSLPLLQHSTSQHNRHDVHDQQAKHATGQIVQEFFLFLPLFSTIGYSPLFYFSSQPTNDSIAIVPSFDSICPFVPFHFSVLKQAFKQTFASSSHQMHRTTQQGFRQMFLERRHVRRRAEFRGVKRGENSDC